MKEPNNYYTPPDWYDIVEYDEDNTDEDMPYKDLNGEWHYE